MYLCASSTGLLKVSHKHFEEAFKKVKPSISVKVRNFPQCLEKRTEITSVNRNLEILLIYFFIEQWSLFISSASLILMSLLLQTSNWQNYRHVPQDSSSLAHIIAGQNFNCRVVKCYSYLKDHKTSLKFIIK